MAAAQWNKIESLFHAAVKLSSAERAAFLAEACAGDVTLRREVEALLAADDSSESATAILSPQVIADGLVQAKAERFTGQRINQYQILSPLGAGGMGEVFLAEDARLQRKVALKLLPASYTNDRERVRRFEQEARAASALNHPNIITIHDLGESESGCFIVMEHVAGRTLRALVAEPIALPMLLDYSSQIAKALHAAHAANIIHRDIKPDNIMVRDDGYVKVLDFGLARLSPLRNADWGLGIEEPGNPQSEIRIPQLTMPGTVMGTVKYMSPEQTRGEVVTAASDIFALGIVLYELATGQHPFQGATMFAVMQAITTQTPFAPSYLKPELPAELNALVLQMLAKDAVARPSAKDIAATLDTLARGSGTTKPATSHQPPATLRHTVGRATERAELQAAFRSGRSSLLCVAGEPGIGKTTLVEDWLTELAATESSIIARGRCSERLAGTEAYLPLLEALESLLAADVEQVTNLLHREKMKQIAPTWYAQVASLSHDDSETQKLLAEVKAASQERMKRELAAFLTAVAQAQPLVIFFDDLHWADVSTIDLLNFLASKFATMRVLIVVTYRPSDMLLAKHPFLQIRPDLQARGLCRELLLEFLSEAEIAEYLALEFPGHNFPSEFPQLIHAKTEGSPLFMADLVRYLRDREVIAHTSGTWALEQTLPDIERELPESVRGMIERKIAQLEPDDHKLLTAASVQGYEFDSAVVAQVLNLDADEVEERLEKLERVFAFVKLTSEAEFPNGELTLKYRFIHVLYQNALYGTLRMTRKASLSAAVAQSLETFYGEEHSSIAVELANLFEVARDFVRATDYFIVAAQAAATIPAHEEAVALARRGIRLLPSLPDTPERMQKELTLQLTFGFSLNFTKGLSAPEVGTSMARAREICQQLGNPPQLFHVLFGLHGFYFVGAKHRDSLEIGEQLLRLAEMDQDPIKFLGAHAALGFSLVYLGEVVAGRDHLEQMVAIYQPERTQEYLDVYRWEVSFHGRICLAKALWLLGYPDQAVRQMQATVSLVHKTHEPQTKAIALEFSSWICLLMRNAQAAQEYAEACMVECELHGLTQEHGWASIWRSGAIAEQGWLDDGAAGITAGVAALQAMHSEIGLTYFQGLLAEVLGKAGAPEKGMVALAEGFEAMYRNEEREFEAELHRVKGDLLIAGNRQAEAENSYQQAIAVARQQSTKSLELRAATSLARLWQQQGKLAEARQMLAEIYGWFTEGFDTADLQDAKALLAELQ